MRIRAAGWSHQGTVREKNDDHYCLGQWVEQGALAALSLDDGSSFWTQYGLLAAVADGMGGYAGGALASRIVLETLSGHFYAEKRDGASATELIESLQKYFEQTQRVLEHALRRKPELAEAGTTLAGVALLPPDVMVVFHAGDSRVLRASGGYLRPLTTDHTPVAADILSGRMSEEQASTLPVASQLTHSLGLEGDSSIEIGEERLWSPGDAFLMGSDGWHGLGRGLSQRAVRNIWRDNDRTSPDALVRQLVNQAVSEDGRDNATMVMVQLWNEAENAEERSDDE